jgi:hypothetical protein
MNRRLRRNRVPAPPAGLWLVLALAAGCANPVPPTGGPEDRTPPRLVVATPAAGSVNVAGGTVTLRFSEAVDEATVARALVVVPEPDGPPEVEVRGETVTVRLGALRPGTTYVLTFETGLRDRRGVPLTAPLTYAFSTGSRLDRGTLEGRVVDGATEAPRAAVDMLAYPTADSAATGARPLYRTQTDRDGRFRLAYLGPAPLFVVAAEDRNRNRRVDVGEAFAVPPVPLLIPRADTLATDSLRADSLSIRRSEAPLWRLARPDTAAPRAERVRSYAPTRHAVRYTAAVRPEMLDPARWALADTTGQPVPVRCVYALAREPRQVFFETEPLTPRAHVLVPGPVADSTGRTAHPARLRFVPAAARDTARLRLVRFDPEDGRLVPGERAAFRLTLPLPDTALVTVRDTLGAPRPFRLATDDNIRYTVEAALPFDVRLALPGDSVRVQRFRAFDARDLGALSGTALLAPDLAIPPDALRTARIVVIAEGPDGRRFLTTAAPGTAFTLGGLPAGAYRLSAFADLDDDGRWTPGRIAPYRPAEPAATRADAVTVRARWDTALPDTLVLR